MLCGQVQHQLLHEKMKHKMLDKTKIEVKYEKNTDRQHDICCLFINEKAEHYDNCKPKKMNTRKTQRHDGFYDYKFNNDIIFFIVKLCLPLEFQRMIVIMAIVSIASEGIRFQFLSGFGVPRHHGRRTKRVPTASATVMPNAFGEPEEET